MGLFLKAVSRSQEKAMDLLGTLCRDFLLYRVWVDESILSTNLRLADIESQVVSHFPEFKEHVQADVVQIKVTEMSVKTLEQKLI